MCDSVCVGTARLWQEEDVLNPLLALSLQLLSLFFFCLSSSSHSHLSVCDKQRESGACGLKSHLMKNDDFPAAAQTDVSELCSVTE